MQLKWMVHQYSKDENGRSIFSEFELPRDDINSYEGKPIEANFGLFRFRVCSGRQFKNGTRQWMMFVNTYHGTSNEIITLVKVHGRLSDLIQKTEELMSKFDWTC